MMPVNTAKDWTIQEARDVADELGWWLLHRDEIVRKAALAGLGIRDLHVRTSLAETTVGRIVRGQ